MRQPARQAAPAGPDRLSGRLPPAGPLRPDTGTTKGEPKPRLVQQCQGIQEAMTTLLAALARELNQPLP